MNTHKKRTMKANGTFFQHPVEEELQKQKEIERIEREIDMLEKALETLSSDPR